jgi:hypothetical protein
MAKTLGSFVSEISRYIGREGDTTAETVIKACVNTAVSLAASLFDLPAYRRLGEIDFDSGVDELLITTSNKVNDIIKVRNTTDEVEMGYVPLEIIDLIVPTSATAVRWWSRDGDSLLVRPTPTKLITIEVRYTVFPDELTDPAAALPFEGYDDYVTSVATALVWAAFEEVDAATLWQKVSEVLAVPKAKLAQARKIIAGLPSLREEVKEGG